ncbi:PP2C family protein-serine/threonine phosphatase [Allokutzneria sp. NRRL B-24872]|uniref:PP2C family protein-serine/threonine phosphatase n=1 Tax=Allokutzneria sp. NRRL B-24872 TaxID=1137961 RepID=UPI000A3B0F13|nr:PP2C family protein-serine/threonine phosphatase [Allokutzneria sp. NRRL B-24872]
MPSDSAWYQALSEIINASHVATADDLVPILESACAPVGIRLKLYLCDLSQRTLHCTDATENEQLTVDATIAGRAFRLTEILPGRDAQGAGVLWVPVLDGTERLGVAAMRLPADADPDDPALRERCWTVAGLIGHLVVAKLPYGDLFHRVRRTAPLTVASELLWQLLPPQTFACRELVVAATMERYDQVGGDGFDYAVDDKRAYLAVFDSTGHDLAAGLLTSSVLAATRNARRAGADLPRIAASADAVLSEHHPGTGFTTAVLAELDLSTGALSYLLAGHPPPVLLRRGSVVKSLAVAPRVPLGLSKLRRGSAASGAGVEQLEPGDRLLLHTDGVTEARDHNGTEFGIDRLVDLTERHEAAGLPAPETLRRITHAVLDHQSGNLQDDATLMLVEWSTGAANSLLPHHDVS